MSLVQAVGTRVLLDLTKNTLGGGAVVSSCSQSCASCPSAGSCGAANGYGGFGSGNGMSFTTQASSGTGTGINTGMVGAAVMHQGSQLATTDSARQDGSNKCNTGHEAIPMQDTKTGSVNRSWAWKNRLDFLIKRESPQPRTREQKKLDVAPIRTGDVINDVLKELGLL